MAKAFSAAPAGGKKSKPRNKKRVVLYSFLGAMAFVALITWWAMQPLRGGPVMALCRVFAEKQLKYPQTLQLTTVDWFGDSTRLYYTFIGPFGENRSSMIDCRYQIDPATKAISFYSIKIDKNEIRQDQVEAFNKSIPFLMRHKMNNIIPPPYKDDDLYSLKRD
jgi:hypothetical protein